MSLRRARCRRRTRKSTAKRAARDVEVAARLAPLLRRPLFRRLRDIGAVNIRKGVIRKSRMDARIIGAEREAGRDRGTVAVGIITIIALRMIGRKGLMIGVRNIDRRAREPIRGTFHCILIEARVDVSLLGRVQLE